MAGPALRRLERIERMVASNEASAADAWRIMAAMSSAARSPEEKLQLEAKFAPFKEQLRELQRGLAEQRAEIGRLRAEADEMARIAAERQARHPPPTFVLAIRSLLAAYL